MTQELVHAMDPQLPLISFKKPKTPVEHESPTKQRRTYAEELIVTGALLKVFRCPSAVQREFVAKVILTGHPLQVVSFSAHHLSDSLPWIGTLTLPASRTVPLPTDCERISLTLVVGHGGVGLKTFFIPISSGLADFDEDGDVLYRQKFYVREKLVHSVQLSLQRGRGRRMTLRPRIRLVFSPMNATAVTLEPFDARCETQIVSLAGSPIPEIEQKSAVIRGVTIKR